MCSGVDSFSIAAGETLARPNYLFQHGTACDVLAADAYSGNTYNVSAIQVTLTSVDDENVVYSFVTGDDGWAHVVMPPGDYDLAWSDQYGVYADGSLPAEQNLTIGGALYRVLTLDANSETYAVSGVITEAGTGDAIFPWVETFKKNPDAVSEPESFRNAQGQGNGAYMVRFPEDTGYTGNQVILTYSDRIEPYPHVQQTFTTAMNPAADSVHNVSMPLGGAITGYVHDDDGLAVEGVQVSATSIQPSPQGGTAYMGGARWYTRTQADGSYMIAGLPTNADYKVNFAAYYDVGMPLQIKYADYYRKTWKNRPYLDSLNESSTPIWVDHTSVPVTLGHMTGSIDETISLGGYVALHADGPAAPTGAVYCDVMYQVPNGKWVEIDSGYTTGGTFQKLWKVLPTGHYRLYYADYFGRGSGTWEFDLAAGEKKYTSVIVPAPINAELPALAGSFAGLINGGLDLGGTGGLQLVADTISALPPGSPAPPTGMLLYADSTFAFVASSADTTGTWTLTLPYDPGIPDAVVSNIRVWHVKSGGIGELLAPIAWNTTLHTVQVQTHSLSPFQVVYSKQKVTLGTPTTSGSLKSNRTFTAYVTLSPLHTPGLKSAQVKAYTYNKRSRKWVVYKIFKAVNQAYRGGTRCKASVKLKKGTYRLYGYAPADAWHLATLGKYRTIKVK